MFWRQCALQVCLCGRNQLRERPGASVELRLEGVRSQEGCSQLPVPPSGLGVVLPPEAGGEGAPLQRCSCSGTLEAG